MKADMHPDYVEATITCVCGHVIKTRSTQKSIKVEICSNCHPFFTGRQKLVDTAGRIDRFRRKYAHLEKGKAGGAGQPKVTAPAGESGESGEAAPTES